MPLQNRYRVHWLIVPCGVPGSRLPDIITLTSNGTDVPPPNDKFLFLHFRIAEILAVSGVGEKIEAALNESCLDVDSIRPDGSTDIGSILSRKMLMII